MKKMFGWMVLVLALVGFVNTFGADLQSGTATISSVTTNAVTLEEGVIDIVGELKLIQIDVANGDPFDLDITDAATGAVILSKDDITADLTLVPQLALTGSAGTALTEVLTGGTNTLYGPVCVLGLNVTAGAATAGTNSVTVSVIADKTP